MTLIFVFIVLFAVAGVLDAQRRAKKNEAGKKSRFERTFATLKDLKIDNYFMPDELTASLGARLNQNYAIGFDNTNKKICFFDKADKSYIFEYSKILQCELDIDGETVSKQSTSSTVGRAVLGGILTGGVGAIIGGTTGKRTSKETIKSMDLKIIVNDTTTPVFKINFFTGKAKKGTLVYKTKYAEIEKWHAIVSGLIRSGSVAETPVTQPTKSASSELTDLFNLKLKGAITEEEFQAHKKKLLS